MSKSNQCRLGLHIGLNSVAYTKIEKQAGGWKLASSGVLPFSDVRLAPEQWEAELRRKLQQVSKQESLSRESVHVSLHSRYCVTRVATGDLRGVESQITEIESNGQHYLQLGLGEKLIGQSIDAIDDQHYHGHVAIIKRGLLATLEDSIGSAGLEIEAVDSALTCVCRVVGLAGLDQQAPLLIVWYSEDGAEICLSYQGRMQLNYQISKANSMAETAETISKHLKRLKRFCDRYRQVENGAELNTALVIAPPAESRELKSKLEELDLEQIFTIEDLQGCASLEEKLATSEVNAAGIVSALGGVVLHWERELLPPTKIYEDYLLAKPRSLMTVVLHDCWAVLAAAAVLCVVSFGNWWAEHHLSALEIDVMAMSEGFDEEANQLDEIDQQQELLCEYKRVETKISQMPIEQIVESVATCLPEDTRIDWLGIDSHQRLILKGTMLDGDRSYEILKALRQLPAIEEVALESVGHSANFGRTATFFEIHCEFAAHSEQADVDKLARHIVSGVSP